MDNYIQTTHPQWHDMLYKAFASMDESYLKQLQNSDDWLPGSCNLLAAFRLPLEQTNYVLLGESPYPRKASANGFAFWDDSVGSLWSQTGLSKEVNRATSLRNWIKMFLHARGDLTADFSQEAIARLDKSQYVQTANALFSSFLSHGFLLLNATLVYTEGKVNFHARYWRSFLHSLFEQLALKKPSVKLILFGRVAKLVPEANRFSCVKAEHPYNISFITNPDVLAFFKPLDLLAHHES